MSTITSYPAGTRACQACGQRDQPTVAVNDGAGTSTACERCRLPFENQGHTTAQAVDLAITEAKGFGKVQHRDAMYLDIRQRYGIKSDELFDTGHFEAKLAKKQKRRIGSAAAA